MAPQIVDVMAGSIGEVLDQLLSQLEVPYVLAYEDSPGKFRVCSNVTDDKEVAKLLEESTKVILQGPKFRNGKPIM